MRNSDRLAVVSEKPYDGGVPAADASVADARSTSKGDHE